MKSASGPQFLIALLLAAASTLPARACAVCFGGPQEPLTKGMSFGILSLLGVIGGVLSILAAFFVYLGRREARTVGTGARLKGALPAEDAPQN